MKKDNLFRIGGIVAGSVVAAGVAGVATYKAVKKHKTKKDVLATYQDWLSRVQGGTDCGCYVNEKFNMNCVPDLIKLCINFEEEGEFSEPMRNIVALMPDGGSVAINVRLVDAGEDTGELFLPANMRDMRKHELEDFGFTHVEMSYTSDATGEIGLYVKQTIEIENGKMLVIHFLSENATRNVDYIDLLLEQTTYSLANSNYDQARVDDFCAIRKELSQPYETVFKDGEPTHVMMPIGTLDKVLEHFMS